MQEIVTVYSRVLGKTVVVEQDLSITMKLPLVLFIAMAFSVFQTQAQNGKCHSQSHPNCDTLNVFKTESKKYLEKR